MSLTKANLMNSVYDKSDFQKQQSTIIVESLVENHQTHTGGGRRCPDQWVWEILCQR